MFIELKRLYIIVIILFTFSCKSEKVGQSKVIYLRHVGDHVFDAALDDPQFTLCSDEANIYQYFNDSKGFRYKNEKPELINTFKEKFKPSNNLFENGLIRIRFVVNCKGEIGRLRLLQSDKNYNPVSFDKEITDQLIDITRDLDGFLPISSNQPIDYYQYLIFKIEDGEIKEILP